MNPRTCIVTRKEHAPEQMIRFVLGPENQVVPDLRRKLPGRGVWVTAKQAKVEEAVKKGAFERGFKQKVSVDPELAVLLGQLLKAQATSALGIVKKAGLLVSGFSKVETALQKEDIVLMIHARDASADSTGKLARLASAMEQEHQTDMNTWSGEELDSATGGANVTHLVVIEGGASKALESAIMRLNEYIKPD